MHIHHFVDDELLSGLSGSDYYSFTLIFKKIAGLGEKTYFESLMSKFLTSEPSRSWWQL